MHTLHAINKAVHSNTKIKTTPFTCNEWLSQRSLTLWVRMSAKVDIGAGCWRRLKSTFSTGNKVKKIYSAPKELSPTWHFGDQSSRQFIALVLTTELKKTTKNAQKN